MIICKEQQLSRDMVVCHVAQETRGVRQISVCFTRGKKMLFSHNCSSLLPEQKHTKIALQIFLGWGSYNSKFELHPPCRSQDTDMRL